MMAAKFLKRLYYSTDSAMVCLPWALACLSICLLLLDAGGATHTAHSSAAAVISSAMLHVDALTEWSRIAFQRQLVTTTAPAFEQCCGPRRHALFDGVETVLRRCYASGGGGLTPQKARRLAADTTEARAIIEGALKKLAVERLPRAAATHVRAGIRATSRLISALLRCIRHARLQAGHPPLAVLIVGAGPVGLAAAAWLRRHGHSVTLIDKRRLRRGTMTKDGRADDDDDDGDYDGGLSARQQVVRLNKPVTHALSVRAPRVFRELWDRGSATPGTAIPVPGRNNIARGTFPTMHTFTFVAAVRLGMLQQAFLGDLLASPAKGAEHGYNDDDDDDDDDNDDDAGLDDMMPSFIFHDCIRLVNLLRADPIGQKGTTSTTTTSRTVVRVQTAPVTGGRYGGCGRNPAELASTLAISGALQQQHFHLILGADGVKSKVKRFLERAAGEDDDDDDDDISTIRAPIGFREQQQQQQQQQQAQHRHQHQQAVRRQPSKPQKKSTTSPPPSFLGLLAFFELTPNGAPYDDYSLDSSMTLGGQMSVCDRLAFSNLNMALATQPTCWTEPASLRPNIGPSRFAVFRGFVSYPTAIMSTEEESGPPAAKSWAATMATRSLLYVGLGVADEDRQWVREQWPNGTTPGCGRAGASLDTLEHDAEELIKPTSSNGVGGSNTSSSWGSSTPCHPSVLGDELRLEIERTVDRLAAPVLFHERREEGLRGQKPSSAAWRNVASQEQAWPGAKANQTRPSLRAILRGVSQALVAQHAASTVLAHIGGEELDHGGGGGGDDTNDASPQQQQQQQQVILLAGDALRSANFLRASGVNNGIAQLMPAWSAEYWLGGCRRGALASRRRDKPSIDMIANDLWLASRRQEDSELVHVCCNNHDDDNGSNSSTNSRRLNALLGPLAEKHQRAAANTSEASGEEVNEVLHDDVIDTVFCSVYGAAGNGAVTLSRTDFVDFGIKLAKAAKAAREDGRVEGEAVWSRWTKLVKPALLGLLSEAEEDHGEVEDENMVEDVRTGKNASTQQQGINQDDTACSASRTSSHDVRCNVPSDATHVPAADLLMGQCQPQRVKLLRRLLKSHRRDVRISSRAAIAAGNMCSQFVASAGRRGFCLPRTQLDGQDDALSHAAWRVALAAEDDEEQSSAPPAAPQETRDDKERRRSCELFRRAVDHVDGLAQASGGGQPLRRDAPHALPYLAAVDYLWNDATGLALRSCLQEGDQRQRWEEINEHMMGLLRSRDKMMPVRPEQDA